MKKSAKDNTFGAPKPLPGQAGYKVTETQVLELETKDMETKLLLLQEKMKQQQLEAEKTAPVAGSTRWKSSRPEKGSIRSYGKEVTEKHKVKTATLSQDLLLGSSGKERQQTQKISQEQEQTFAGENFTTKDVDAWTCEDVGDWLGFLQLHQYIPIFTQNEINGGVLLDLTLEDLDYLSITVLAHRKTILRAIEEIRLNQKPSAKATPRLMPGLVRSQSASSRINAQGEAKNSESNSTKSQEAKKSIHWSQIEPIANNPVKGGSQSINGADDDIFDEAAEREAFQKAVAEWRGGDSVGKKVTIVRENEDGGLSVGKASSGSSSQGDGAMWVNPFAPAQQSNGSLLAGNLDEAQEHAEFVKAVEQWRTQSKSSVQQPAGKVPSFATGSESVMVGSRSPTINSSRVLADSLAKQMEREQKEMLLRIEKQKIEAQQRLVQANKELEKLRIDKEKKSHEEINEKSFSSSKGSRSPSPQYKQEQNAKFLYSKSPRVAQIDFSDSDNEAMEKSRKASPHIPSTVKISLVESTMGGEAMASSTTDNCIVEYDSDDN